MARAAPIKSVFIRGELSPLMAGRVESDDYNAGLDTCLGFIPVTQGGLVAAPGSRYVSRVKDSAAKTLLVRFEYSVIQAYVLEFGNLYMRIYRDRAPVTQTAQNITAITRANPAVVTYDGADTYANGDRVLLRNVGGMSQVNGREFAGANVNAGANTFELSGINSSAYTAYTSGGTIAEIVEVVTPYTTADLFSLQFTQSADVLYVAHPSYAPRKITRTSHTAWTLNTITFMDGPYLPTNSTLVTFTPSATTGAGITITASSATFVATDVGRMVRIKHAATWGWARIVGYTSATVVTADVGGNFGAATASTFWRMGVWSDTTGYPRATGFYEDRLFFGGCTNYPNRVDGSRSGDYEWFSPTESDSTVLASNAVSFSFGSREVNVVQWLMDDEQALVAGTPGGPWLVRPSKQGEALSPTNMAAKRLKSYGSSAVQAVHAGDGVVYVQRDGRKVRFVSYGAQGSDGFQTPDLTLLSEHITASGIAQMSVQLSPQPVVWMVRNDGVMVGMTFHPADGQLLTGWHRHIRGGAFSTGNAVAESVVTIPSPDGTSEDVYTSVKRTIDGATVRTIEYIARPFDSTTDAIEDAYFVDCGATYDGAPTTTITDADHLEGQTVTILADGAAHPTKVVTAGRFTLDRSASVVHYGLPFDAEGATMRFEAGAQNGTSQGKIQRIHRVAIRVHDTSAMAAGPTLSLLDEVIFRTSDDLTNTPIPPYSGDKEIDWDGDYGTAERVCWARTKPMPCTILAIMPHLTTEDRQ